MSFAADGFRWGCRVLGPKQNQINKGLRPCCTVRQHQSYWLSCSLQVALAYSTFSRPARSVFWPTTGNDKCWLLNVYRSGWLSMNLSPLWWLSGRSGIRLTRHSGLVAERCYIPHLLFLNGLTMPLTRVTHGWHETSVFSTDYGKRRSCHVFDSFMAKAGFV